MKHTTDDDREAGKKLKEWRLARKMSRVELANHIGISFQQIEKYENGLNRISIGRLCQLAEILEAPLLSFLPPLHTTETTNPNSYLLRNKSTLRAAKIFHDIKDLETRYIIVQLMKKLGETKPEYDLDYSQDDEG